MQTQIKFMSTKSQYILQVGEPAAERLMLQHTMFAASTAAFVRRCGIKEKANVLVAGCGIGVESEMIAQWVGEQGSVTAIDVSEEQIAIAKQRPAQKGLTNINYQVIDVYNISALQQTFDAAYCRFLLINLQNPKLALQSMYNVIKKGGILACEESNINICFTQPESKAFQKLINLIRDCTQKMGIDYTMGEKIEDMFKTLGCKNIQTHNVQAILSTPLQKSICTMVTEEMRTAFIKNKSATHSEIDQLIIDLQREVVDQPTTTLYLSQVTQIYGTK